MKTYKVILEPIEDGWWLATAPGVQGCLTDAPTIGKAKRRIRDALSCFVEDYDTAELEFEVKLPKELTGKVAKLQDVQERLEALLQASRAIKDGIIADSKAFHLSMRDLAELIGVSHQRVHQLARRQAPKRTARPGAKRASHG